MAPFGFVNLRRNGSTQCSTSGSAVDRKFWVCVSPRGGVRQTNRQDQKVAFFQYYISILASVLNGHERVMVPARIN